jgi:hypothetical protein
MSRPVNNYDPLTEEQKQYLGSIYPAVFCNLVSYLNKKGFYQGGGLDIDDLRCDIMGYLPVAYLSLKDKRDDGNNSWHNFLAIVCYRRWLDVNRFSVIQETRKARIKEEDRQYKEHCRVDEAVVEESLRSTRIRGAYVKDYVLGRSKIKKDVNFSDLSSNASFDNKHSVTDGHLDYSLAHFGERGFATDDTIGHCSWEELKDNIRDRAESYFIEHKARKEIMLVLHYAYLYDKDYDLCYEPKDFNVKLNIKPSRVNFLKSRYVVPFLKLYFRRNLHLLFAEDGMVITN